MFALHQGKPLFGEMLQIVLAHLSAMKIACFRGRASGTLQGTICKGFATRFRDYRNCSDNYAARHTALEMDVASKRPC